MSHTPGPWTIGEDGDVFNQEQSMCIATVTDAPKGTPEARANARLIAAAPELLAALRFAESLFDRQGFQENRGEAWNDTERGRIRAAIRRAEGQA